MKKISLILSMLLCAGHVYAQTEQEKATITQFQAHFNAQKYAEIFQTFSPDMQKAVPLSMFEKISKDLTTQLGNIQQVDFTHYKGEGIAVYKTTFEQERLNLVLGINDQQQISTLLFQPYVEPNTAPNTTVNAIQGYPKEITDKIFQSTKAFPEHTNVAIAVLEQGKTKYYGVHKHDNQIHAKANQDHVFGIGSITKVMTSEVLAQLVTQNKLKLDDTINGYYAFPFKDNIQLRFQDLANHTSGLPRLPSNLEVSSIENPYQAYDEKKLNEYLQNQLILDVQDNQGKFPNYSNLAVGLLGHSLGLSQQQSFASLIQRYVFDQHQMKNSYVSTPKAGKKLIPAFSKDGTVIPTWEFDTLFAAGGVLSTVEDLMKFAQAQLNDQNAVAKMMQQATTEQYTNHKIGLGWFIDAKGQGIIWHGGNTAGHSSILMLDLKNKRAVSILANVAVDHPHMGEIEKLAIQLLQ